MSKTDMSWLGIENLASTVGSEHFSKELFEQGIDCYSEHLHTLQYEPATVSIFAAITVQKYLMFNCDSPLPPAPQYADKMTFKRQKFN
jgi:hypothetical protein